MSEATFNFGKICPICKKQFSVLWPGQWAYKRGGRGVWKYLCSWKCLRIYDKEGDKTQMTAKLSETSRKAVDLALAGENPLEYLAEQGKKNPSAAWYAIKQTLKLGEPETYEKLPDLRKLSMTQDQKKQKRPPENVWKAETPEAPRITKPVNYDGFNVREVEGNFARYRRSDVGGSTYIDVEIDGGCDTLSYTIEQWRSFRKEHERAAVILGVEL